MTFPHLLAAILALVTVSVAYADDRAPPGFTLLKQTDAVTYAVPTNGPLQLTKLTGDGAHFGGKARISGHYVYGFNDSYVSDAGEPSEPDLYFVPDNASRAFLPYWFREGPVRGLRFSNQDAFRNAAISHAMAAKVKARKVKSATGHLTIWIDQYVANVECDSPVYTARFLRIEAPPLAIARSTYADVINCG
jgi:hypothetical protein